MAQPDRLDKIQRALVEERTVTVADLARRFLVTEETIRRDFDKLEARGVLTRTYGGAVLSADYLSRNSVRFDTRSRTNPEAKRAIARKAAALLTRETVIGLDSSSTVTELLRTLRGRSGITVVTNSVGAIFECLESDLHVLSTGGFLNRESMSLQGMSAQATMRNYHPDICFISCKALDIDAGIFDSNEYEAALKLAMAEQSRRTVLLADHTKFGRTSFIKVMDYAHVDCVVTDSPPAPEWAAFFEASGVALVC